MSGNASNGAQIVSPTDVEIAEAISEVGPANGVPRSIDPFADPKAAAIDAEMFEAYLRDVAASLPPTPTEQDLRIVYTPMHGVGGRFVMAALNRFGFKNVQPVARQYEPDGTFPTV
ncbi:MAG: phospho-sugar mutase, partial [Candidatus Hydrogenedentes bacterium]|nr:phospho-sugar mutase [Candidatus Hydrogenedentota bacterium]